MIKELNNEDGALSRKIKALNLGQFLFLYFVAKNTSYYVTENIMKALKRGEFSTWSKIKTEEPLLKKQNKGRDKPKKQNESRDKPKDSSPLSSYETVPECNETTCVAPPNKGEKSKTEHAPEYQKASNVPLPEEVGAVLRTRRLTNPVDEETSTETTIDSVVRHDSIDSMIRKSYLDIKASNLRDLGSRH